MNHAFFYITCMAWSVCVTYQRCQAPGTLSKVFLGNLGSYHVDISLTRTTYQSIVADHSHLFMETVFLDCCGVFQQDKVLWHKVEMVQECFEKQNNEFEALTLPLNSPHLNQASVECPGLI